MITLYHSPNTRSTSIISLLRLMGRESSVDIKLVDIMRAGGKGGVDPDNPHPEGKVPLLVVDGVPIRERGAIMLWLTDHFDSPLGRGPGHPARGAYLSSLFYSHSVMEPVIYTGLLEVADNPMVQEWCRGSGAMVAALEAALSKHAFLVDDEISAADILAVAPFQWFPDMVANSDLMKGWIARCSAAMDAEFIAAFETRAMQEIGQ